MIIGNKIYQLKLNSHWRRPEDPHFNVKLLLKTENLILKHTLQQLYKKYQV